MDEKAGKIVLKPGREMEEVYIKEEKIDYEANEDANSNPAEDIFGNKDNYNEKEEETFSKDEETENVNKWTCREINTLIDLWEEFFIDLKQPKRNSVYTKIANILQEKIQRKCPYTELDVYSKVETLKKQYMRNKRKLETQERCSKWLYFDRIDSFIRNPDITEVSLKRKLTTMEESNKRRMDMDAASYSSFNNDNENLNEEPESLQLARWSRKEVFSLVRLWEELSQDPTKKCFTAPFYKELAIRLQIEISRDVPYSQGDVFIKIDSLRRQYKKCGEGVISSKWPYFNVINRILQWYPPRNQAAHCDKPEMQSSKRLSLKHYTNSFNEDEETFQHNLDDESESGRWTREDVNALVELWEVFSEDLKNAKRNSHVFKRLAFRLQQKLNKDVPYSGMDIHMKIQTMKRQYKKNKMKSALDGKPSVWFYYDKMHSLLREPEDDMPDQETSIKSEVNSPMHLSLEEYSNSFNEDNEQFNEEFEDPERERWSDEEVSTLLDLWEEFVEDLKQKRNFNAYKQISSRLQQQLQREVPFSELDVHSKMHTMKRQYHKQRRKCQRQGRPSSWRYFDRISTLVGNQARSPNQDMAVIKPGISAILGLTSEECEQDENSNQDQEELDMKRWTYEEVDALIDLWEEYYDDLKKAKRHSLIIKRIASRLQQQIQREVPYSEMDIHNKIDVMKRQYKKNVRRCIMQGRSCYWRYFNRLNKFMGNREDILMEHPTIMNKAEVSCFPKDENSNSFNDEDDDEEEEEDYDGDDDYMPGGGDQKARRWSYEDVCVLIDLWEEFYENLKQKRNFKVYKQICSSLQERLQKAAPYSELEVRSKLQTMKGQYQKNLRKIRNEGGLSRWRYFDRVHSFYGNGEDDASKGKSPIMNVPSVMNSSRKMSSDNYLNYFNDDGEDEDETFIREQALKRWNHSEVCELLSLWEEFIDELKQAKSNSRIYLKIAVRLQQRLKKIIPYTETDVRTKFQTMKRQFRKNFKKSIIQGKPSSWCYFKRLSNLLQYPADGGPLEHQATVIEPDINAILSVTSEEYSTSYNENEEDFNEEQEEPETSRWTYEDVNALINLWDEYFEDLTKGDDNSYIFKQIAARLEHHLQMAVPYTEVDVYNKIESMKKQYKKNLRMVLEGKPALWPYFGRINSFYGSSEEVKVDLEAASMKQREVDPLSTQALEQHSSLVDDDNDNSEEEMRKWLSEDEDALIDLWENLYHDLKQEKNFHVYKLISSRLQEQLQKDVPYSELDIYKKLQRMKRQYWKILNECKTDGQPSEYRYFERISKFLGNNQDESVEEEHTVIQPDINSLLCLTQEEYSNSINDDDENSNEKQEDSNRWTYEEVNALIDLWGEYLEDLSKEGNLDVIKKIAELLQQRLKREAPYSEMDVHVKIDLLTQQYKRILRRCMTKGESSSSWCYFDRINRLLGKTKDNMVGHPKVATKSGVDSDGFTSEEYSNSLNGEEEHDDPELGKWTHEEINTLIDLWEDNYEDFKQRRKFQVYKQIAAQLEQQLRREIPFSDFDVQCKMHTLNRLYQKHKRKFNFHGTSEWRYFERLDCFLGGSESAEMDSSMDKVDNNSSQSLSEEEEYSSIEEGEDLHLGGWTQHDMNNLIDLWEEFSEYLRKQEENPNIHAHIAALLQQRLRKDAPYTEMDVHTKFEAMKREYKKHKKRCRVEGRLSQWRYFDKMHKILAYPEDVLIKHQTTVIKCKRRSLVDLYIEKASISRSDVKESPPDEEPKSESLISKWTSQEVFLLIQLWKMNVHSLNETNINAQIFHQMAAQLQEQTQREIPLTPKDVYTKFELLKRRYKRCGERRPCSQWRYFQIINNFLGWFPSNGSAQHRGTPDLIEVKNEPEDMEVDDLDQDDDDMDPDDLDPEDMSKYIEPKNVESLMTWSKEEVDALIVLWEQFNDELNKTPKTGPVYREMAARLQHQFGRQTAYSVADVRRKIKTLKRQYRKNGVKRFSPRWCYFSAINRFLRRFPVKEARDPPPPKGEAASALKEESKPGPRPGISKTTKPCYKARGEAISKKKKEQPGKSWRREEVFVLIEMWKLHSKDLIGNKKNAVVYKQIAAQLQERLRRNVPFTPKDVHCKIDTLKRQYRKCGKKRDYSRWCYFHAINEFLGLFPDCTPSLKPLVPLPVEAVELNDSSDRMESLDPLDLTGEDFDPDTEKRKAKKWTGEEVFELIKLWAEFDEELKNTRRTTIVYRKMAARLQRIIQSEEPVTHYDVHHKLDTLKRQYKKHGNGPNPHYWRYFHAINNFKKLFPFIKSTTLPPRPRVDVKEASSPDDSEPEHEGAVAWQRNLLNFSLYHNLLSKGNNSQECASSSASAPSETPGRSMTTETEQPPLVGASRQSPRKRRTNWKTIYRDN